MKTNYFSAYVTKVYDGDTITCDINCGFEICLKDQKIRLLGIDTPEVRGKDKEKGIIVRDIVREKLLNKNIILESIDCKKGKYGRWLCDVYIDDLNINKWLLDNNYAEKYL